jgi:hypothetical protein
MGTPVVPFSFFAAAKRKVGFTVQQPSSQNTGECIKVVSGQHGTGGRVRIFV